MKIAVIAPPWLKTYPGCFYGIEIFIHNLCSALHEQGHEVVLFTVKGTTTPATKRYWYHDTEQYKHIHRRWYEAVPVVAAHMLYSLNVIRQSGDFDIIHDNNSFMGPSMLAFASNDLPPILHTLHEPLQNKKLAKSKIPDTRAMFEELSHTRRMYFNGVSESQLKNAPDKLKSRIAGVVHNAVDISGYVFSSKKQRYFLSVGRVAKDKGQAIAAKLCSELGVPLKMAGTVGATIRTKRQLQQELADPTPSSRKDPDFLYYKNKVLPYIKPGKIDYIGTVFSEKKAALFSQARAFLMPITWEEPFGLAVIDALASGTPVVAMKRGAMPEIIQHGVNGFLARNEAEFKKYMQRVDEIDPAVCRQSVIDNFSSNVMAENYIKLYKKVIASVAP